MNAKLRGFLRWWTAPRITAIGVVLFGLSALLGTGVAALDEEQEDDRQTFFLDEVDRLNRAVDQLTTEQNCRADSAGALDVARANATTNLSDGLVILVRFGVESPEMTNQIAVIEQGRQALVDATADREASVERCNLPDEPPALPQED